VCECEREETETSRRGRIKKKKKKKKRQRVGTDERTNKAKKGPVKRNDWIGQRGKEKEKGGCWIWI
jgi:hypothetical protein